MCIFIHFLSYNLVKSNSNNINEYIIDYFRFFDLLSYSISSDSS